MTLTYAELLDRIAVPYDTSLSLHLLETDELLVEAGYQQAALKLSAVLSEACYVNQQSTTFIYLGETKQGQHAIVESSAAKFIDSLEALGSQAGAVPSQKTLELVIRGLDPARLEPGLEELASYSEAELNITKITARLPQVLRGNELREQIRDAVSRALGENGPWCFIPGKPKDDQVPAPVACVLTYSRQGSDLVTIGVTQATMNRLFVRPHEAWPELGPLKELPTAAGSRRFSDWADANEPDRIQLRLDLAREWLRCTED